VDRGDRLDMVPKRKISSLHHESNPDHLIVQPIASHYTDWAIPALTEGNSLVLLINVIMYSF
jgi:hypothetical protein